VVEVDLGRGLVTRFGGGQGVCFGPLGDEGLQVEYLEDPAKIGPIRASTRTPQTR
jgi:hypothetical protein